MNPDEASKLVGLLMVIGTFVAYALSEYALTHADVALLASSLPFLAGLWLMMGGGWGAG